MLFYVILYYHNFNGQFYHKNKYIVQTNNCLKTPKQNAWFLPTCPTGHRRAGGKKGNKHNLRTTKTYKAEITKT